MSSSGFDQVVDILRRERDAADARLRSAQAELDAATHDYRRAERALQALEPDEDSNAVPRSHEAEAHLSSRSTLTAGGTPEAYEAGVLQVVAPKSIRAIVQDLLEKNDRWFTTDEITDYAVQKDATDKGRPKVRHNVRSSLYGLRLKNLVETDEARRAHRARKWSTQSEAAPAVDAAEAAQDIRQNRGGERDPEAEDRLRDLRPDRQEDPVDPGRRPGVGAPG